jgi:serine/threonine protein kinase/tetratricopeptide (TPR) repeat protein
MTPERWRQVEGLFLAASELEPAERGVFLDQACAEDAALRVQVDALLAADGDATGQVVSILGQQLGAFAREEANLLIGRHLGPYRVLGELGHGGMGTVYRAVRDDDAYRKEVAVKVLQQGLGSGLIARFRRERQILAGLEHPCIARLLEGGSTEEGLPYIVMEHVEGKQLTDYCREAALPLRQRLELFRQVCGAVQYAHQQLVVHRDIKPSNILVSRDGTPKLLDFGIAKLLDPEQEDMAETRTGLRIMTPEYASPEQVRGQPVSTATDVYSLGVVLYELLTDAKAQSLATTDPLEMLRVVCETDPPPPSSVVPRSMRRALAGDLDNIVQKAMHKEPSRRYGSVEQLSQDVQRYLEGMPVQARRDTLGYRTLKFVRRRKIEVASAVLIVASLSTGLVVALQQQRQAERRFEEVRGLANSLIFDLHDAIADIPGTTKARELVVAKALHYLERLAQEAGDNASLLLEVATAFVRIGNVQGNQEHTNLGRPLEALSSYERALGILKRLAAARPEDLDVRHGLARALIQLGYHHAFLGHLSRARETMRAALELARKLPVSDASLQLQVDGYRRLGFIEWRAGDPAQRETARRHLEIAEDWARRKGSPHVRYELGLAHTAVAQAIAEAGDPAAAVRHSHEARRIFEVLLQSEPANTRYRRELMVTYAWVAIYLGDPTQINLGKRAEALPWIKRALNLAETNHKTDSQDVRAVHELAIMLQFQGNILRLDDPARAAAAERRAIALLQSLPASALKDQNILDDLALTHAGLARSLEGLTQQPAAMTELRKAIAIQRKMGTPETSWAMHLATYLRDLARLEANTGVARAAEEALAESRSILEKLALGRPRSLLVRWQLAETYEATGALQAKRGSATLARHWYDRSLQLWQTWERDGAAGAFPASHRARLEALIARR